MYKVGCVPWKRSSKVTNVLMLFSCSVVSNSVTQWTAAHLTSLSITNFWSLLKMFTESVMPSSRLVLCHPLFLLPPIPPSISVCVLVAQSCPTLCEPMDCSPPRSSVHEIFQARILEWVAISFSRGSSKPRDRTRVSCTAGKFFTD